jgi:hypothetical protein
MSIKDRRKKYYAEIILQIYDKVMFIIKAEYMGCIEKKIFYGTIFFAETLK